MIVANWQVIVNPVTFQPVYSLKIKNNEATRNTKISIPKEMVQDKKVNETEVMLMLLEALPEEEVGPSFTAWKAFVNKNPELPTN